MRAGLMGYRGPAATAHLGRELEPTSGAGRRGRRRNYFRTLQKSAITPRRAGMDQGISHLQILHLRKRMAIFGESRHASALEETTHVISDALCICRVGVLYL